ncbi:hypothetical protein GE118_04165 [Mycoplasma sp. NEAQ87857]|uniref:Mbov_0399 family ICE element protein n=1 Tax=Mycoplasma sp. NEAQ87857 TaxID=2683967 RepID=UPI001318C55A|nr:hypothetical protein [Mycoplasma sp. NEAQ87857]QGZ97971.1 hypothetical protein GE118_04165 [Mycoplasma sp. NEAQ87857]
MKIKKILPSLILGSTSFIPLATLSWSEGDVLDFYSRWEEENSEDDDYFSDGVKIRTEDDFKVFKQEISRTFTITPNDTFFYAWYFLGHTTLITRDYGLLYDQGNGNESIRYFGRPNSWGNDKHSNPEWYDENYTVVRRLQNSRDEYYWRALVLNHVYSFNETQEKVPNLVFNSNPPVRIVRNYFPISNSTNINFDQFKAIVNKKVILKPYNKDYYNWLDWDEEHWYRLSSLYLDYKAIFSSYDFNNQASFLKSLIREYSNHNNSITNDEEINWNLTLQNNRFNSVDLTLKNHVYDPYYKVDQIYLSNQTPPAFADMYWWKSQVEKANNYFYPKLIIRPTDNIKVFIKNRFIINKQNKTRNLIRVNNNLANSFKRYFENTKYNLFTSSSTTDWDENNNQLFAKQLKSIEKEANQTSDNYKFNFSFELSNETSSDPRIKYINIYIDNRETKLDDDEDDKLLVVRNLAVHLKVDNNSKNKELWDRLEMIPTRFVDFNTNTTELVKDNFDYLPPLKANECQEGAEGCTFDKGTYVFHAPLTLIFNSPKENEVLYINGKAVDVINGEFKKSLFDNRLVDKKDLLFKRDEENTNEYEVLLVQYKENTNNNENNIKQQLKAKIVIESQAPFNDFKWYAWDPTNNPNQQAQIEPYVKDSNGKVVVDEKGNKIPNPDYDPEIDPSTGTKKELVWVNTVPSTGDSYSSTTGLPIGTKTFLFKQGGKVFPGFIAEAISLNKGALQELVSADSSSNPNYSYYSVSNDVLQNGNFNTLNKHVLPSSTFKDSYFSNEGNWLFSAKNNKTVNTYKIINIYEPVSGQNASKNKKFSEVVNSPNIIPFWNSKIGNKLEKWLNKIKFLSLENIKKLSYEEVLNYIPEFANYEYSLDEANKYSTNRTHNYINIRPSFKKIPLTWSKQDFINRYLSNESQFNLLLDDFATNFDNKDKVKIYEASLTNDNRLILKLNLKFGVDANKYNLVYKSFVLNVAFTDDSDTVKDNYINNRVATNINLSLNFDKVNEWIKENVQLNRYSNQRIQYETTADKIFNEEDQFDKLDTVYISISRNRKYKNNFRIQIETNLKESADSNLYTLEPRVWYLFKDINDFVLDKDAELKGKLYSLDVSLINLNGLNDVEQIKKTISDEVDKRIKQLNSSITEYTITNLDSIANDMLNVIEVENLNPSNYLELVYPYIKKLNISLANNKGYNQIPIVNFTSKKLKSNFDLSSININDLEIAVASKNEARELITNYVQSELSKHNLVLSQVLLSNIDQVIELLLSNTKAKITILPNNALISGSISFYVSNTLTISSNDKSKIDDIVNSINIIKEDRNIDKETKDKLIKDLEKALKDALDKLKANDEKYKDELEKLKNQLDDIITKNKIKEIEDRIKKVEKDPNLTDTDKKPILDGLNKELDKLKNTPSNNDSSSSSSNDDKVQDGKKYDLAKIKLQNLTLNTNKIKEIREQIIQYVKESLLDDGLLYQLDYLIVDINNTNKLQNLLNNQTETFVIKAIDKYTINQTSFDVVNQYQSPENETKASKDLTKRENDKFIANLDTNNKDNAPKVELIRNNLIDLSKFQLSPLSLNAYSSSEITSSILNYIKSYFTRIGTETKFWRIKDSELQKAADTLLSDNNKLITTTIKINGVYGLAKNYILLEVNNFTDKKIVKNAIAKDEAFVEKEPEAIVKVPMKVEDKVSKETRKRLLIGIPLGIFGTILTLGLGYFVYIRKFKHRIK